MNRMIFAIGAIVATLWFVTPSYSQQQPAEVTAARPLPVHVVNQSPQQPAGSYRIEGDLRQRLTAMLNSVVTVGGLYPTRSEVSCTLNEIQDFFIILTCALGPANQTARLTVPAHAIRAAGGGFLFL